MSPAAEVSGPTQCPTPLGTATEIAATPRADQNLELLALQLDGDRMSASDETYARVVADVGAIRAAHPELADIGFFGYTDGKSLVVRPDAMTMQRIHAREYSAWKCLNDFYELQSLEFVGDAYLLLTFKGNYNLEQLRQLYMRLPGIRSAETNLAGGDASKICLLRDGASIEYVVDRASGDCLAGCTIHDAHYFVSTRAGEVEAKGSWNSAAMVTNAPDWWRVCSR